MVQLFGADTTIDASEATGFTQQVRAQIIVDGGSPYGSLFQIDTTIDNAILSQLFPGRIGNGTQEPGMQIGRALSTDPQETNFEGNYDDLLIGPWSVTRSAEANIQTATITMPRLKSGRLVANPGVTELPYFDHPTAAGQSGDGLRRWQFTILYRLPSSSTENGRTVLRGIMDTVSLQAISSGSIDTVTFADNIRQWVDTPGSLVLPAGHGITAQEVVRRLFEAAGYPFGDDFRSGELSRKMLKPIDLANGQWLSLAQSICDTYGARIVDQGNGVLEFVFINPEAAPKPYQWLYNEQDIVVRANGADSIVSIESATESFTRVSVRGSKQVTKDPDGGAEQKIIEQKSYNLTRDGKPWLQSKTSGTIISSGAVDVVLPGPLGEPNTLFSTTTTVITDNLPPKGESTPTTDSEIVSTRALYNPITARFTKELQGDGSETIEGYHQAYLEENVADSGEGRLFRLPVEQLTDYSITERFYNEVGELFKTETRIYGMYCPKAAKVRVDGDPVLSPNSLGSRPINNFGQYLAPGASNNTAQYGNTSGIATDIRFVTDGNGNVLGGNQVENCILLERRVESYESENGYLTRKTTTDSKWAQVPGNVYVFADGSTSSEYVEQFVEVGQTIETYAQLSESEVLRTIKTISNLSASGNSVDVERYNGSLEAVPRKTGYLLREDFESDADFENALAADRFEQQEITHDCTDEGLEAVRPRKDAPSLFVEWAETTSDLGAYCERLILSGRAFLFNFSVPVNALLREGDYMRVIFDPLNVNHDCFVLNLTHTGGGGGPMLTNLRVLCLTHV